MKIDAERLRGFLDCMHEEADERDKHTKQIAEIVKSAKEAGFDTKAVRKVFARERMDEGERARQDDLLETYEGALGGKGRALQAIRDGMPVGEAAKAHGVHRATLARARHGDSHVANQPSNATTPHDPSTGEVIESPTAGVEPLAEGHPARVSAGEAEQARSVPAVPEPGSSASPNSEPSKLARLIAEAKVRVGGMTDAERDAHFAEQRESWVRGEMGMGNDADEAACRNGQGSEVGTPIQQSCGGVDGHASVVTQPRAPGLDGRAAPAVATGEGAGIQSGPHDNRTWDEIVPTIDPRLDRRRATA